MVMIQWIFLIPIRAGRSQKLPFYLLCSKNTPDICRKIFAIPLIDQTVYLPCFFPTFVVCISIIYNTDKPNTYQRKVMMQVFLNMFHISGKSRLRFCNNYLKFTHFCIFNHFFKTRSAIIQSTFIIIRICSCYCKPMSFGIFTEK